MRVVYLANPLIMSIKLLAIELYRSQQVVDRLAAQLEATSSNMSLETSESLREQLRQAEAELQRLRKMLDDKKASSSLHSRTFSF